MSKFVCLGVNEPGICCPRDHYENWVNTKYLIMHDIIESICEIDGLILDTNTMQEVDQSSLVAL